MQSDTLIVGGFNKPHEYFCTVQVRSDYYGTQCTENDRHYDNYVSISDNYQRVSSLRYTVQLVKY